MSKILAFDRNRRQTANRGGGHDSGGTLRSRTAPLVLIRGGERTEPEQAIAISVVVPTKGRPQLLNRCLASLVLQNLDPQRFEIIVVDDGPDDGTREVATDWAAHTEEKGPQVVYIPSMGPYGPAAARNHGWRAARGAVIAFTDDDTIARTDWLRNGLRAIEDGADAVCGRIVMPLNGTPTDYELDAKRLETAEFVTANCFCRRRVLEDIGGFDERFKAAWREDSDLYFRLMEYHASIVREPRAVMMHPVRPAGWGVSLKQVRKVQFDALLYKKHPLLYRRRIRASPRWDFYLTVSSLLLGLGALAAGKPLLAGAAGAVWLGMTTRFCAQRLRNTSHAPSHVAEMVVTSALIPPLAVFWRAVGAWKFRVGFL
ncbi:glycosyltransferase family 2 protein [Noviherbaspirillum aridicola]|uniref:Glycosyl transferase n=1 Tax=Noviherbaspirillum aridicola TaxID=2849687 RepID=A0ABQ4QA41_9BURK|nr:glycosyltransferase family A protein [Noviherbaspirillum aridicola]GIZ53752.1 glycosyl transferase [Noviherbaspirillum aridicola]